MGRVETTQRMWSDSKDKSTPSPNYYTALVNFSRIERLLEIFN